MKTFWTRTGLVIFGVLLALLLAEAGLRTAGGVLLFQQNVRNNRSLDADGTYRILCLGESTTQGQWPHLLEEILNERSGGRIRFKVIDKGVPGTTTGVILSRLKTYLDIYDPHMVVAMMGVNDDDWVWKNAAKTEGRSHTEPPMFWKNMRLRKLLLYFFSGRRGIRRTQERLANRDGRHDIHSILANVEQSAETGDKIESVNLLVDGIKAFPENTELPEKFPSYYDQRTDHAAVERLLKSIVSKDPENRTAYIELGITYFLMGNHAKCLSVLRKARASGTEITWPAGILSSKTEARHKSGVTRKVFEAVLEADPHNRFAYSVLVRLYSSTGDRESLENLYLTTMKTRYRNPMYYLYFGDIYFKNDLKHEAKSVRRKGCAALGIPIRRAEETFPASWLGSSELRLRGGKSHMPPSSISLYRDFSETILFSGIKLVCMQYPLRDIEPLKDIYGSDKGILYVENKNTFQTVLNTSGINALFTDMFAGDFGHCTPLGNRLIAENLANAVLGELFDDTLPHRDPYS